MLAQQNLCIDEQMRPLGSDSLVHPSDWLTVYDAGKAGGVLYVVILVMAVSRSHILCHIALLCLPMVLSCHSHADLVEKTACHIVSCKLDTYYLATQHRHCGQVTSAGAAEMVAVSTILSYDLYRGYFRPRAKGMLCWQPSWPLSIYCVHVGTLRPGTLSALGGRPCDSRLNALAGPEMLLVSRICVVIFGFAMGGLAILFDNVGVSLNYM